jgi:hypothetical protein
MTVTEATPTPRLSLVDPDNTTEELAEAFKLLPVINVFRPRRTPKRCTQPMVPTWRSCSSPWNLTQRWSG